MAVGQTVNFQRADIGVEQPEPVDFFSGVNRHFDGAVGARGAGREHFADPVGGEAEIGRVGQRRQAFPPPAGEVGDQNMRFQMQLRFEQNPPAAGAAAPVLERLSELHAKAGTCQSVFGRRPGLSNELAVDDFADQVIGQSEEVFVGREALRGLVHGLPRISIR